MFRAPAPTLGAVRQKLEAYWGDLFDDSHGSSFKRIVIGDLVVLEMVHAGIDWAEASGGRSWKKVRSDFEKAARAYDRYLELQREGPTDKWGENTASDIAALLEGAEAEMLSLPAADLAGVEKKLTAIWQDQAYDPIEASTVHVTILRDLRRLITATY